MRDCHSFFLKRQISLLRNSESFQDTAIVCRNGILLQNSLLIFLLFKEELQNIQTVDEELTIFLPEVDIELVQEMIEKLLSHSKKPPNSKSIIAQFSLILPFETQIKPNKCEMGRRRMQRTESVCAICGKNLKRTKWEAEKHEQLHSENPGFFKCLVPSGSLGKCNSKFVTKDKLQEHMITLHKVKYSKCEVCDKTFNNEISRQSHINSVHTNLNLIGRTRNTNIIKCSQCGAKLPSRKSLKHHVCGESQFKCGICDIYYLRKYKLEQHITEKHEESEIIKV